MPETPALPLAGLREQLTEAEVPELILRIIAGHLAELGNPFL